MMPLIADDRQKQADRTKWEAEQRRAEKDQREHQEAILMEQAQALRKSFARQLGVEADMLHVHISRRGRT